MLVIEFSENEEKIFQQTVEWLTSKLNNSPELIKPSKTKFYLNLYTRTFVNENGKSVYLTAKEFDLLYFLSSHKGQVFTKEQIYEKVWGYDNAPDASNLSSFIRKLRLKIEPHPDNPRYIITVWGVGYKFSGEEKP
ncbi:TPA: winged helix-turn-helix domain-containing protein [Enterococcus faecium]|nr:winged helix-turn-helix domain-containing protein [Enterococcus faecium]HAR1990389.1 winged helix-turn-helix domain-containing protein [Enterococcus faecium]HCR3163258.1 winged helix-turn-helix domain-containing protein [Enterococcus faecium]HCR3298594.1 winged helix-turn-helix domain-containing protein [Enterococcus faecium]HCR3779394.1 winged helix-turn-helix domain-containing protein [Enterococcus faecium]